MKVATLGIWLLALILSAPVAAESRWPEQGWQVMPTPLAYEELLEALHEAVEAEGMFVVTEAGPTEAAANRGVTIPGNRVVGVFRNDYAVRILRLSVPAMIEAPMRFYVTENDDGSATLSWKTPTHLLSPYMEAADEELETVARELDTLFAAIAQRATEVSD
ncbi:DUF302 domain-containing protein [Halomonas daqiaonensis]|uniref:Uncharacterized conserved protein, DUF302 family n=1 Tax=Halomonas daqiaonensis TaxID=650850 RepID=A0A1H7LWF8_9GAMM|nr:DUF302 domain-containing protein [Halomonas daqiaonensis]SEL03232.1 Uncharacterized conserved protein, DUF302 family [Halomonas daqiaonensis]